MDWTEIELGKLGKTYNGLSGKSKDDFGIGKPYIPYINVFNNIKINPEHLEYVQIKKGENQNQVKYGDLFFTTSSETIKEVGMTSVLLNDIGEVYLNSFCFGFRLNDFEILLPEFAPYLFRSDVVRHKISLLGQGSTRYNLSKTELLKRLVLKIPSKPEQTRIAQILSTADRAIAQTEALIAKYQRIKTGLMQDLLTRGIDEHGRIRSEQTHRFKTEKGLRVPEEWEVANSSDLIYILNGGTPSTTVKDYWDNGNIPWLSVDDFNNGQRYVYSTSKHITMLGLKNSSTQILPKDSIIISARGTVGVISQLAIDMSFNQSCYGLISKNAKIISNDYLYYALRQIFDNGKVAKSGSVFDTITRKTFNEILIPYPRNESEFNRIVEILSRYDDLIVEQKRILQKLQSLKTGLMQDLLSGRVRVKVSEPVIETD
jgi:type I restriction enzyme S subunit